MSITTYDELQDAVGTELRRTEYGSAGSKASITEEKISLVEARLKRILRERDMEQRATASIDDEYVAVPSNFGGVRRFILTSTSPIRELSYVTPDELSAIWASSTTGRPKVYTIIADEFQLAPTPDTTYTAEIIYWKKFTALSDSNTSNWILASHPDIYFYGTLLHLVGRLVNDPRIPIWKGAWDEAIRELKAQSHHERYPSTLQMRSDVTVI